MEVKDATQGLVTAAFATIGVVDHDGDYTEEGAFTPGQEMVISEWNHSSVTGPHPPIGEGVLRVSGREAIVDAKLFMDTPRGAAMAVVLKALGGRVEWSYAFDILEHGEPRKDVPGRVLRRLSVFEASPCWRGAGVNTRTLTAKDREIVLAAKRVVDEYQAEQVLAGARLRLIHLDALGV
jgi:hypothetical protein